MFPSLINCVKYIWTVAEGGDFDTLWLHFWKSHYPIFRIKYKRRVNIQRFYVHQFQVPVPLNSFKQQHIIISNAIITTPRNWKTFLKVT
jgi:hypothetical protein